MESSLKYALDEAWRLMSRIPSRNWQGDPVFRYLCAIFAELPYYHVPQWEIDEKRHRAKLIPCDAFQKLCERGIATDVRGLLEQGDFGGAFVVQTRQVIVTGVPIRDVLFLGFRGTKFFSLADWRVNLCICPTRWYRWPSPYWPHVPFIVHRGFFRELLRVLPKIESEISKLRRPPTEIVCTGHSLGGAVAALAHFHFQYSRINNSGCIFGAPRFGDATAHSYIESLTVIRRRGDMVPLVPPKFFGYAPHWPVEYGTDGRRWTFPFREPPLEEIPVWLSFLVGLAAPHDMETYRQELGVTAGAAGALLPLAPFEKL